MKRISIMIVSLFMVLSSSAQWRVSSIDNSSNENFKLLQVIETDQSTFVYGTFNQPVDKKTYYTLSRKTRVEIKGEAYKIKGSVNFPVYDEADTKWIIFSPDEHKSNFILEFEKFPSSSGFAIVSDGIKDKDVIDLNLTGINLEKIDSAKIIKAEKFIQNNSPVIIGNMRENGNFYVYYIKDNVNISFHTERNGKDILVFIDIVNRSDHGVSFDTNNVYINATTDKGKEFRFVRYTPESYDDYFKSLDYQEAKNAVGGLTRAGESIETVAVFNTSYNSWGRIGLDLLAGATKAAGEKEIEKYMQEHPKTHPVALKSNSVKPGEVYSGFVAFKYKKSVDQELHFKIDDYDFTMMNHFTK